MSGNPSMYPGIKRALEDRRAQDRKEANALSFSQLKEEAVAVGVSKKDINLAFSRADLRELIEIAKANPSKPKLTFNELREQALEAGVPSRDVMMAATKSELRQLLPPKMNPATIQTGNQTATDHSLEGDWGDDVRNIKVLMRHKQVTSVQFTSSKYFDFTETRVASVASASAHNLSFEVVYPGGRADWCLSLVNGKLEGTATNDQGYAAVISLHKDPPREHTPVLAGLVDDLGRLGQQRVNRGPETGLMHYLAEPKHVDPFWKHADPHCQHMQFTRSQNCFRKMRRGLADARCFTCVAMMLYQHNGRECFDLVSSLSWRGDETLQLTRP